MFKPRKGIAKEKAEIKAYDNVKQHTHNFGDFVFYKSMSFRSSYLEDLAKDRNRELNLKARKIAAEYNLKVLLLQYNTLLFNCENTYNEIISYKRFADFIVPLFEGKMFDQYLIILMVRSLANVILKKVWAKLIILRHKWLKVEENSRQQKRKPSRKANARSCFISFRPNP